jgi:molybdopterin converting factor small subunit
LETFNELDDYQLATGGLVFDTEYIYVNPETLEPEYIYIPNTTDDNGLDGLKALLKRLIIDSKLEMTSDNFVQILLEASNKQNLKISDLKNICNDGNKIKQSTNEKQMERQPMQNIERNPVQTPQNVRMTPPVATSQFNVPKDRKAEEVPKTESKKADKKGKINLQKIIFSALQLVLVAIVAAVYFSGILTDENGMLNAQYLLGVVIGLACVDFVVYRELFKNSKDKKEKTSDEKEKSSKVKKPMVSMPGKDIPKAEPMKSVATKSKAVPHIAETKDIKPVHNITNQTYGAERAANSYDVIDEFESEATVVMDSSNTSAAYLELYENGLSSKFVLNKDSIIIGKLRSQCDYTINNKKISKIHAEFIRRGDEYFVRDCNSTNGIYLNGSNQRIQNNAEYPLYNGDRITLADVDLIFNC